MGTAFRRRSARTGGMWRSFPRPRIWWRATTTARRTCLFGIPARESPQAARLQPSAYQSPPAERRRMAQAVRRRSMAAGGTSPSGLRRPIWIRRLQQRRAFSCGILALGLLRDARRPRSSCNEVARCGGDAVAQALLPARFRRPRLRRRFVAFARITQAGAPVLLKPPPNRQILRARDILRPGLRRCES